VFEDGGDFGKASGVFSRGLQIAGNSGQADNLTTLVPQRDLVGEAPAFEPGRVEVELELESDGGPGAADREVLFEKAHSERLWKDLSRRATEKVVFGSTAAAGDQGLVDHPVAAVEVLDEEHHVRHPVEQLFDKGRAVDEGLQLRVVIHEIVPILKSVLDDLTRKIAAMSVHISWRRMSTLAVFEPVAEIEGRLFNLQRCSVHDGPGIRTTVFLKGCPLECAWCHNPEGISASPELMLNGERCLGCGACSDVCPVVDGGAVAVGMPWDRTTCLRCGACVEACPADARELAGTGSTANELVDVVERDRPFFEASGGGVTFSGGEPLSQPEFLASCLRACRVRGLHTAVDTCGLAPREVVLEIAGLTDLVLFDLKQMDSEAHRRHTGADNRLILENLRALSSSEAEIWIRVPLIPGVNDDDANFEALGDFLSSLPRRHRVFVLPYHPTAVGKTSRLEGPPSFIPFSVPDAGTLGAARQRLQAFGLDVVIGGSL